MWRRTWQIGGVAYQAPEPGDYLVSDLGPESILMVRQQDGRFPRVLQRLSASRHAAACRVLTVTASDSPCAYHGWQFDLGGVVINVPNAADYRQGNPCGKLSLTEVRVEELLRLRLVQHGCQARRRCATISAPTSSRRSARTAWKAWCACST
jgi:phenylpropionate dioxygenase-like ring-hydroxylating dioxygenase large terminal subunit